MVIKKEIRKGQTYVAAFVLPLLVTAVVFIQLKIAPFGERTLAVWDANVQYVDFLAYFKKMLSGQVSWSYTFSKTLGGDLAGFVGYYLLSPFNLLVVFFEDAQMPLVFQWIYILKMACSAVTCQYYWNQRGVRLSRWSVFFSATYALTSYNFAYGYNIMWLDAVIVLPLLAAGIERLAEGKKAALYVAALAAGLLTNYYMGYILCVFSVLYFFAFWYVSEHRAKRTVLRFFVASMYAAGLSGCVLLPMALSIRGGKADFTVQNDWLEGNFSWSALLRQGITASFAAEDIPTPGLPPLFCGSLIFLLICLFFLNREIEKRKRRMYGALLAVLLFCAWSRGMNRFWHGFSEPFGCAYRYIFVLSFLMICMARISWERIRKEENGKRLMAAWGIGAVFLGLSLLYGQADIKYVVWDACLLLCAVGVFLLKGGWRVTGVLLLVVLHMADLGQNGKIIWNALMNNENLNVREYEEHIRALTPVLLRLGEESETGYRLELDYSARRSYNDAMLFDYDGLSHYSSTEKIFLEALEERLEISPWAEAETPDEFADSLLGIRYIVSKREQVKSYPGVWNVGDYWIYENERALPFLFGTWEEDDWAEILTKDRTAEWPQYVKAEGLAKEQDDRITCTILMGQDGAMLTTIPWDTGWTVQVDGRKVRTGQWLDTFLSFELDAGKHEVVMQYCLPGAAVGSIITVLFALAGIFWFAGKRKYAIMH